jgi:hypothetical protein
VNFIEASRKDLGDATRIWGAKPLWTEAQSAFNDTCRELFIEGFDSFLQIILDNDRMHDSSKHP